MLSKPQREGFMGIWCWLLPPPLPSLDTCGRHFLWDSCAAFCGHSWPICWDVQTSSLLGQSLCSPFPLSPAPSLPCPAPLTLYLQSSGSHLTSSGVMLLPSHVNPSTSGVTLVVFGPFIFL